MCNYEEGMMNREEAFELLKEYTKNESLIKHALAVEAAMRAYARKYGEDEELWGITGLLHDFDYEKYPSMEEHALKDLKSFKIKATPKRLRTPFCLTMITTMFRVRISWTRPFTQSMNSAGLLRPLHLFAQVKNSTK